MKACKLLKDLPILTSVLDGGAGRLNPGEKARTYCVGGWMDPTFCLVVIKRQI